jgi:glyoxylase-like metal-dependent hydrolase (beta-lactamase superfamily II)
VRRTLKRLLLAVLLLGLLTLILVVGTLLTAPGSKALVPGATLAQGRVTTVVDGMVAMYLVEVGGGQVLLVDAGMDGSGAALLAALQERGLGPEQVQVALLTHGHGDHIGGLRARPGGPVAVLAGDRGLVEGRAAAGNLLGRFKEAQPTGLSVQRALKDGEILEFGDSRVEVMALPGHSRGSAAFLIQGVLFLGDSAAATEDGALIAAPPVFSEDRSLNQASLRDLCQRLAPRSGEIHSLAFGHQGALDGLDPLLDWCEANPG